MPCFKRLRKFFAMQCSYKSTFSLRLQDKEYALLSLFIFIFNLWFKGTLHNKHNNAGTQVLPKVDNKYWLKQWPSKSDTKIHCFTQTQNILITFIILKGNNIHRNNSYGRMATTPKCRHKELWIRSTRAHTHKHRRNEQEIKNTHSHTKNCAYTKCMA